MRRSFLLAGAALLSLGLAASVTPRAGFVETAKAATAAATTMAAPTAQEFVTMATGSNMFEIQSSKLAVEKASSAVKQFAHRMIEDHTKAAKQMMATVQKAGGGLAMPTAMDPKHAGMMSTLDAGSGASFDKQYVTAQVQAHEEAVALFTAYANGGDEPILKAFAAKTLPVLQSHLKMIQSISQKVS